VSLGLLHELRSITSLDSSIKNINSFERNLLLFFFFVITGTSCGQVLVNFDSSTSLATNSPAYWGINPISPSTVATGIVINTNLTRGSSIQTSGPPVNSSFGGSGGWSATSTDATSFIFEFKAQNSYTISLSSLTGYTRRSDTGPTSCNVDFSLDGGITYSTPTTFNTTSKSGTGNSFTVNLSSILALQNICPGKIVRIRLNPVGSTGNWYLLNGANCLKVNGTVTALTTPTFTQVNSICKGGTLSALPTISNNSISGSWLPSLNNNATTTYTFTETADVCNTTTITITVNPNPLTSNIYHN